MVASNGGIEWWHRMVAAWLFAGGAVVRGTAAEAGITGRAECHYGDNKWAGPGGIMHNMLSTLVAFEASHMAKEAPSHTAAPLPQWSSVS